MQVLLHKHAKLKCILISTCTQKHIKLGPATFVTQELYATAAKRTTLEAQRKFPKYFCEELADSEKVYNQ